MGLLSGGLLNRGGGDGVGSAVARIPKTYYWGAGQTGRLDGRNPLGTGDRRIVFDTNAQENIHGGEDRAIWLVSSEVDSNFDSLREDDAPQLGEFLKFPVGRWNIYLYMESRIAADTSSALRFLRVTPDDDDQIVHYGSGYTTAFRPNRQSSIPQNAVPEATGHTFEINAPDILVDGTEQFYFLLLGLASDTQSNVSVYLRISKS